ncbi:MAG: holo-ACP synthase [Gammaproteobacteria bacterium]|nr:holo-ACP synthase [Gammaproteobacteria bacterium]
MLAGIGVDIAEIERFQKMIERYGDRVASRLLTAQERQQFYQRQQSPAFLASRFAAKEAASKALGSGIAQGIGFRSIEVINDPQGKPELAFHDAAERLARQQNIQRALLSLSDEKHYVVAMVVLEAAQPMN